MKRRRPKPRTVWSWRSARPGVVAAAILAAFVLAPPVSAQTAPGESLPVLEHTLSNGMRFLILERDRSPTVAFIVHYPVGSVNERLGNTGIAHVLEHMLFKGTDQIGTRDADAEAPLLDRLDAAHEALMAARSASTDSADENALELRFGALKDSAQSYVVPNEFDAILSRAGARGLNATTSHEATRYFVELPSNRAELWFALEAERMRNPVFREFFSELDVVREERRMRLETSPGALLQTAALATAFQVHPYGVPPIGHLSDLDHMTRRHAEEYFRRYYGARNAVVAIVGNVEAEQMVQWAEQYFASTRPGELPPTVSAEEPPQRGERRVIVEYDAEPQLAIAWKGVSGTHPDAPALSVLAAALTGGRTSRLHKRLIVKDRSAIQVSAYQSPGFRDPRLFWITAVPRAPFDAAQVEATIYEEIDSLKARAPSQEVLERFRNQMRAGDFRRLSRNLGLASQLADSEATFGDWRRTFQLSQLIQDVTPEDVQRVANQYLVERTRTVGTLVKKAPSP